jgi:hypothetical protein
VLAVREGQVGFPETMTGEGAEGKKGIVSLETMQERGGDRVVSPETMTGEG